MRSARISLDEKLNSARDKPVFEDDGDHVMAKGQKRSNREIKKPKKEKPKEAAAASPFSKQSSGGTPKQAGGKG
jgi:hypothetical protein